MARVKGGTVTRARRKKILKMASGYFGSKHLLFKTAKEQVLHSLNYAFNDRRKLKSDYRKFMFGLKQANVQVNRKMLSELAINDPAAFADLVKLAKKSAK